MKKTLRRITAVILCVAMLTSGAAMFASADEALTSPAIKAAAPTEAEQYPVVFVTGIGQSNSYQYASVEDKEADIADNSTDRAINHWNLFCNDFGFAFKDIGTIFNILVVAGGLIGTLILGKNIISKGAVDKVVTKLFTYNTIDAEGNLPDVMYTPLYKYSVADMTDDQRDTFYSRIPCKDVIGDLSEDMLYCFNYSAFSFTFDNSDNLDDFIENYVLPQTGAEKVVLVPMSMGASVVSAYLYDYGDKGQVARVVSIVGAWDGSDTFGSLLNLEYCENAPDLLYNGVVANLIGEPWGYLVNGVLRLFRKAALRSIIDEVLGSIVENLLLKTPSLLALCPHEKYQQFRAERLEGRDDLKYITEQTDRYYNIQCNLEKTTKDLEAQGVDFFYICGYDLEFGEVSSDYEFFKFMKSSPTTNSDEIIQISSTAPGATYAPHGQQLSDSYISSHDAKYITPDKSVDVSTCFFPDRVWLFHRQKHELEYNNTALRLAFDLACGKITSVDDPNNIYPQFNDARNVKKLTRDYIPDLNRWLAANEGTLTDEQKALIEKNTAAVNKMLESTVNDYEADNAVIEEYRQMLITLGIYGPDTVKEESGFNKFMKKLNDFNVKTFGSKGFLDR